MSEKKIDVKAAAGLLSLPGWLSLMLFWSFIGGCCSGGCRAGYERSGEHLGTFARAVKDVWGAP